METSASRSPLPALPPDEERPSGHDPDRDGHDRRSRRERAETEQRDAVVPAVRPGLREHLETVEEREQPQAKGEDRGQREERDAAEQRHALIVARSGGDRPGLLCTSGPVTGSLRAWEPLPPGS